MKILSIEEAASIFEQKKGESDESWRQHSIFTAKAAYSISKALNLNCEKAYTMGLLHDIGRSFTNGQFRHISEGYEYMLRLGYPEHARICLTHSFAIQDISTYIGEIDISEEEKEKYQYILKNQEYDEYDRLIQLCDNISTSDGYVLPEQKFVKNAFKYGIKESTLERWKKVLDIYYNFSRKLGKDVKEFLT